MKKEKFTAAPTDVRYYSTLGAERYLSAIILPQAQDILLEVQILAL